MQRKPSAYSGVNCLGWDKRRSSSVRERPLHRGSTLSENEADSMVFQSRNGLEEVPRSFAEANELLKSAAEDETSASSRAGLFCVAFLVPEPGGADDVVQLSVARLPAEFTNCLCRAGDEDRRIAGAAREDLSRDRMAGDAAGGFD